MSSSPLVSSFRKVTAIPADAAHDTVIQALRDHDKGLLDIQTAIPLLKAQIDALKTASSTSTTTVISGGGGGGGGSSVGFGTVNNQSGITAYTTQTTDFGTLLILSDASPVAVTLNSFVSPPYSLFAINWGAGLVTFTPQSGTINYIGNLAAASMPLAQGYIAYLVYDGVNWWAETIPVVPLTFAAVAHEWLNSYDATTGLFTATQPTANDISNPYVAVTAAYAALTANYRIEATSGTFTITLPDVATVAVGKAYSIKNSGTGTVTVATTSSQTIDGQLTQALAQWDDLVIYSNGTAWRIE